jgi:hypothetical protein
MCRACFGDFERILVVSYPKCLPEVRNIKVLLDHMDVRLEQKRVQH